MFFQVWELLILCFRCYGMNKWICLAIQIFHIEIFIISELAMDAKSEKINWKLLSGLRSFWNYSKNSLVFLANVVGESEREKQTKLKILWLKLNKDKMSAQKVEFFFRRLNGRIYAWKFLWDEAISLSLILPLYFTKQEALLFLPSFIPLKKRGDGDEGTRNNVRKKFHDFVIFFMKDWKYPSAVTMLSAVV